MSLPKFQNKYRIPSARLLNWDYRSNGIYFITICTGNREHFFGEILDGKMNLNHLGQFAEYFWFEIPNHFSNVKLGNFVVMPNHVHGILIIDLPVLALMVETLHATSLPSTPIPSIPFDHQNKPKNEKMSKISPKSGSISTIIRSYKSVVTKNIREINPDFQWQTRFHDHIVRNEESFKNIQNYIENNPLNWDNDKFRKDEI